MKRLATEIVIQDSIYEQLSTLAGEMQISQDDLLILAIEDFLQRYFQKKMQDSMKAAYEDGLDQSQQSVLEGMRLHQRQLIENEP